MLIRKDLTRTAVQIPLSIHGNESRSITMNTTEWLGKRGLSMSDVWSVASDSTSVSGKMRVSASFPFKAFWMHLVTDMFRGKPEVQGNVRATKVILGLCSQSCRISGEFLDVQAFVARDGAVRKIAGFLVVRSEPYPAGVFAFVIEHEPPVAVVAKD